MLHPDDPKSYYFHSLPPTMTMSELDTILVYGIGVFVLVVLPVVAITLYEAKEAKKGQAGGVSTLLSAITSIFVYSTILLLFVMLLMMALVGASTSKINPAFGIYYFFFTDWLDVGIMESIKVNTNFIEDLKQLEAAKAIVTILAIVRLIYILVLMSFFLLMFSFGAGIVLTIYRGNNDINIVEFSFALFVSSVVSTMVFWILIWTMSTILNGIIFFSTDVVHNNSTILDKSKEINIVNDTVSLFRIGANNLEEALKSTAPIGTTP